MSNRIRQMCKEVDISIPSLGETVGISTATICRYANGETQMREEDIIAIANFFQVTTDYILGVSDLGLYCYVSGIADRILVSAKELDDIDCIPLYHRAKSVAKIKMGYTVFGGTVMYRQITKKDYLKIRRERVVNSSVG